MKKLTNKQRFALLSSIVVLGILGVIVLYFEYHNRQLLGLRDLVLAALMIVQYISLRLQGYRKHFATITAGCCALLMVIFAICTIWG